MIINQPEAFVTLVTNDSYVKGALVLAASIRDSGTKHELVCLVTSSLSLRGKILLEKWYTTVTVEELNSNDAHHLAVLGRPELGPTFTKIYVWALIQYKKVVFIDADMLVLKNIDDLFEYEEFSACPDSGWPDCFNSGLFVCRPSTDTLNGLLDFSRSSGSFDGGDQGLLNSYFSDWSRSGSGSRRIPFLYNVTFNTHYSYVPAFMHYSSLIRAVHFIGGSKPWMLQRTPDKHLILSGGIASSQLEFVRKWWECYDKYVSSIVSEHDFDNSSINQRGSNAKGANSSASSHHHDMQQKSGYSTASDPKLFYASSNAGNLEEFAKYKVNWKKHVDFLVSDSEMSTAFPPRIYPSSNNTEENQPISDNAKTNTGANRFKRPQERKMPSFVDESEISPGSQSSFFSR